MCRLPSLKDLRLNGVKGEAGFHFVAVFCLFARLFVNCGKVLGCFVMDIRVDGKRDRDRVKCPWHNLIFNPNVNLNSTSICGVWGGVLF